jgi:hypothetical protein
MKCKECKSDKTELADTIKKETISMDGIPMGYKIFDIWRCFDCGSLWHNKYFFDCDGDE